MVLVVRSRAGLNPVAPLLRQIHDTAESCMRQLSAWTTQIEEGEVQGKRHLTGEQKRQRKTEAASRSLRMKYLQSLPPTHPLHNTPEARQARNEPPE